MGLKRPSADRSKSTLADSNASPFGPIGISRSGLLQINKHFNVLRIPPLDEEVMSYVTSALTFYKLNVRPQEGELATEPVWCYKVVDIEGYSVIICGAGVTEKLTKMFEEIGYEVYVYDLVVPSPERKQNMLVDRKRYAEALGGEPRKWQLDLADTIEKYRCGQIHTSTGSGKSAAIAALCYALPKARIAYATTQQEALSQQYTNLLSMFPDVKLVKSRTPSHQPRVVCSTVYKLKYLIESGWRFDYTFVDEHHKTCTERQIAQPIALQSHKIFAFSANYKQRIDRADLWSEVAYGPLRVSLSYKDNVQAKNVVPIEVRWRRPRDVRQKDYLSAYQRMHYGIYTNDTRNDMIAADARRHEGERVLIIVRTVEHGLILRRMLNCPLVYGSLTVERQAILTSRGLLDEDEPLITKKEVRRIKQDFTNGETKLVIATNIWEEAVDFPELAVVIRTDAQSSEIKCTQICGRPSRLHDEKSKGIIYDYHDEHDPNLRQNARGRAKFYSQMGYDQVDFEP